MKSSTISQWVEDAVQGDSTNEIARRAEVTVSTVHRQRTSGNYSPETVAKIARAYGRSVLEGLVIQGTVSRSDISTAQSIEALQHATDQQLLDEIAVRLEKVPEHESEVFDKPNAPININSRRKGVSGMGENVDPAKAVAEESVEGEENGETPDGI